MAIKRTIIEYEAGDIVVAGDGVKSICEGFSLADEAVLTIESVIKIRPGQVLLMFKDTPGLFSENDFYLHDDVVIKEEFV